MNILSVVGTWPNFMKIAPLHRAMQARGLTSRIVHTGQYYDKKMSDIFFEQLSRTTKHFRGPDDGRPAMDDFSTV